MNNEQKPNEQTQTEETESVGEAKGRRGVVFPDGVINRQAYLKYLAFSKHHLIRNHLLPLSDGGEVNLACIPSYLRKQTSHLPPKEQEYVLEQKRLYAQALQRQNLAKAEAFGRIGRHTTRNKNQAKRDYEERAERALEQDIVTLLGRLFSVGEVVRILVEDNGIQVSPERVRAVLKANITRIEKAREDFRNRVTDVRLYNKRPRLEELAWMYSKMKMRYIMMNSEAAYNAMLKTLEQIRKEAEGDVVNINGNVDVNLNVELQAHIEQEILKTINVKEIILGRIAARMNYDTSRLVAGLHNSYYNRFVRISGDFDPDAEMQYPSLVNYDFAEIERKHADDTREEEQTIEAPPVTAEEHSQAEAIRSLFLNRIRQRKTDYEAKTSTAVLAAETGGEGEEGGDGLMAREDYPQVKRPGRNLYYDRLPRPEKRKKYEYTEESKARQLAGVRKSIEVKKRLKLQREAEKKAKAEAEEDE